MRKLDVLIYGTDLTAKPFTVSGGALVEATDAGDLIIAAVHMSEFAAGWIRLLTRHTGPVGVDLAEYDGRLVVAVIPGAHVAPETRPARVDEKATTITPPEVRWVAQGPEGVN